MQEQPEIVRVDLAPGMPRRSASASISRSISLPLAPWRSRPCRCPGGQVVGHSRLQPSRHVRFAEARNVSEVLVVGIQPEIFDADVTMDDVTRPDHVLGGPRRVAADAEVWPECDLEAEIARVLPIVPDEVVDRGDARRDRLV